MVNDEQNGFRKGRSCRDHVFVLTSIIRNRKADNLDTFGCFVDLQKAFDSVDRDLLLWKLFNYNIMGKLYRAIKSIYLHPCSCVRINNEYTDWFDAKYGVRQGDTLSPTLFNLYINDFITELNELDYGVKVAGENIGA